VSVPVLERLGVRFTDKAYEILVVTIVSIISLLIGYLIGKKILGYPTHQHVFHIQPKRELSYYKISCWLLLAPCFLILVIQLINIPHVNGSKFELVQSGIYKYNFVHNWILLYTVILYTLSPKKGLEKWVPLMIILCTGMFVLFLLQERNTFIHGVLSIIIIKSRLSQLSTWSYLAGVIAFLSIPALGKLKGVFLSSTPLSNVFENYSLRLLFSGEFLSASRNLETVLNSSSDKVEGLRLYAQDIINVFPSILVEASNGVTWFNKKFYAGQFLRGEGEGFGVTAEAIVSLGYLGVPVVFCVLGVLFWKSYAVSFRSKIFLASYSLYIPYTLYAIRGDLSYFFSPLLNHIAIPVFLLVCVRKVVKHTFSNKKVKSV
jgi:hypothetical protein